MEKQIISAIFFRLFEKAENSLLEFIFNTIEKNDIVNSEYRKIYADVQYRFFEQGDSFKLTLKDFVEIVDNDKLVEEITKNYDQMSFFGNNLKQHVADFKIKKLEDYAKTIFSQKLTTEQKFEQTQAIYGRINYLKNIDCSKVPVFSDQLRGFYTNVADVQDGKVDQMFKTGYALFDNVIKTLQRNTYALVAARPSVGKTTFALNLARNINNKQPGAVTVVFSLETAVNTLIKRYHAAEFKISMDNYREGFTDHEKDRIKRFNDAFVKNNERLIIYDDIYAIEDMHDKLKQVQEEHGNIDAVVIDHATLISARGRYANETEKFTDISRRINNFKKEFNCLVINIVQLSRGVESRENKRPVLSDLRSTGAWEQDADLAMMLYRPDYYKKDDTDEKEYSYIECIVRKNREGMLGEWGFKMFMHQNRIEEMSVNEYEQANRKLEK